MRRLLQPLVLASVIAATFGLVTAMAAPRRRPVARHHASARHRHNQPRRRSTPRSPSSLTVNPFAGQELYVYPDGEPAQQADRWRTSRPADARLMDRLAAQPQAQWLVGSDYGASTVAELVNQALRAHAMPVLVVYNIPRRDCGSYSAGGAASAAEYRAWIREVGRGLGQARVAVIVEPDALAGIGCLSSGDQRTRVGLLADAIRALTAADPNAGIYLDAGNSAWEPAGVMARRLLDAGVSGARGFALNVSNFNTTAAEAVYGQRVLSAIGPGHGFVIDTSRNGNGPAPANAWCNPGGRALGQAPEAAPNLAGVDALLWVKAPGESDGTCNGGPPAGDWWPEYALALAQRAGWTA